MLINCKVKPCKQGVLYIVILSSNTGVYTVCHLSYEPTEQNVRVFLERLKCL